MLCVAIALVAVLAVGAILTNDGGEGEPIKELMRDAVLHESNKVAFFGMEVNPGLISAFTVTGILLVAAALLRVFAVPRFRLVPGKLQLVLETAVGMFDNLAKSVFGAGAYIFVSTIFELSGAQAITTAGHTVALPAPLSDINGAIAMGCLSYLAILSGGIFSNGLRGVGRTLKEFSLPISMSFRLFGAMLSGLLVTELVYAYLQLSFALPVFVAVVFTLLHAVIQTYVLTMLTALFYGEVSEPSEKHAKKPAKPIAQKG